MAQIFQSDKHIDLLTKKILKRLDGAVIESFKKIRSTNKQASKLELLYAKLHELKETVINDEKKEIEEVEKLLADEAYKVIQEETKGLNSEDGGTNAGHLRKLKKKIIPKPQQVRTAMKGRDGKLVTSDSELRKHTVKH